MPEKKRQHYVPRLLLKPFSADQVNVQCYVLESNRFVERATIKEQCKEDYFYGKDGKIEHAFSVLETAISKIFETRLVENLDSLTIEEIETLKIFINFQLFRTTSSANDINIGLEGMMKSALKENPKMKTINLASFRIEYEGSQFRSLSLAYDTLPALLDLEVKFLINTHDIDFITSDDPVILYNQWVEHHPKFRKYPSGTGLANKGIQIFLPITPKICVHLYDSSTYSVGSKQNRSVGLSKKDIQHLNRIQNLNGFECIYFRDLANIGMNLNTESAFRKENHTKFQSTITETQPRKQPDGKMSKLVILRPKHIRVGAKFSFSQVIEGNNFKDYNLAIVPLRKS